MPGFVLCQPQSGATVSVAPCVDVEGVPTVPVVVQLPAPGAVTFENANEIFAYAFVSTLTVWLLGVAVGQIVNLVRR